MKPYQNLKEDSGVVAYETGPGFIRLQFEDGGVYLYTDDVTGSYNIKQMQKLAARGSGLCTFINQNVREAYAAKER